MDQKRIKQIFSKIDQEVVQDDKEWVPDSHTKYVGPERDHDPVIMNTDLDEISRLNHDIERINKKKLNDKVKELLISKKNSEIDRYCEATLYHSSDSQEQYCIDNFDNKREKRTVSERVRGFEELKKENNKSRTITLACTDDEMPDKVYSIIEKNILEQEYERMDNID